MHTQGMLFTVMVQEGLKLALEALFLPSLLNILDTLRLQTTEPSSEDLLLAMRALVQQCITINPKLHLKR